MKIIINSNNILENNQYNLLCSLLYQRLCLFCNNNINRWENIIFTDSNDFNINVFAEIKNITQIVKKNNNLFDFYININILKNALFPKKKLEDLDNIFVWGIKQIDLFY